MENHKRDQCLLSRSYVINVGDRDIIKKIVLVDLAKVMEENPSKICSKETRADWKDGGLSSLESKTTRLSRFYFGNRQEYDISESPYTKHGHNNFNIITPVTLQDSDYNIIPDMGTYNIHKPGGLDRSMITLEISLGELTSLALSARSAIFPVREVCWFLNAEISKFPVAMFLDTETGRTMINSIVFHQMENSSNVL